MKRAVLLRTVPVLLAAQMLAATLSAQTAPEEQLRPVPTDLRAYLRAVDEATGALKSVSYTLRIWDRQPDLGFFPIVAEVVSEKVPDKLPRLKVDARSTQEGNPWHNTIVHNGESLDQLDWNVRRVVRTPTRFLGRRMQRIRPELWLTEYTIANPFEDEVQALELEYEARREIAGVLCDVILVDYRQGQRSRWAFGVSDLLPRRVERLRRGGARIYEISNLRQMNVITPGTFEYTLPEDFEIRDVRRPDAPAHKRIPDMLQIGREAPRFELTASNGQTVSRVDLRGSVVVLHFWNAWSPAAAADLPQYKTLHDRWRDQGVVIYGVNCYEDAGKDAGAAFQRSGQGYPLLLAGDELARRCRVPGVPAWLVIDPAGRVEDCGIGPADAERIDRAIESGLSER